MDAGFRLPTSPDEYREWIAALSRTRPPDEVALFTRLVTLRTTEAMRIKSAMADAAILAAVEADPEIGRIDDARGFGYGTLARLAKRLGFGPARSDLQQCLHRALVRRGLRGGS